MASASFTHSSAAVGTLILGANGIDSAQWGYNLNTKTYPTYGGEVVQILSVYIDDLTLTGSCSTYSQMEAIYAYFAAYMQIATQGKNTGRSQDQNVAIGNAYNLEPMQFSYPERGWNFSLYPKSAPGFAYGWDTVLCTWQMTAHIEDLPNEFSDIKDAIKDAAVANQLSAFAGLNDQISPHSGDPETDPFQTFDPKAVSTAAALENIANYYTTLIASYKGGDFTSLTGGVASRPSFGPTPNGGGQNTTAPGSPGGGGGGGSAPGGGSGTPNSGPSGGGAGQPSAIQKLLPSSATGGSRSTSDIKLVVLHDSEIAYTPGSTNDLNTLYNVLNTAGDSVHIGLNGDGVSMRMVNDNVIAYTESAFNPQSVSIEQIGFYGQSYPSAQTDAAAHWISYWCHQYNIPFVHSTTHGVCMHSDLGAAGGGHVDPGPTYPFQAVLNMAKGL